jgi:hypothetical protein
MFDQLVESITGPKHHVRYIKGPYWIPDVYPDEDEHYGYDFIIDGEKVIVGEEPEDDFRYIYTIPYDEERQQYYSMYREDIMPLVDKAIEDHNLKEKMKKAGLSDVQASTAVKI